MSHRMGLGVCEDRTKFMGGGTVTFLASPPHVTTIPHRAFSPRGLKNNISEAQPAKCDSVLFKALFLWLHEETPLFPSTIFHVKRGFSAVFLNYCPIKLCTHAHDD